MVVQLFLYLYVHCVKYSTLMWFSFVFFWGCQKSALIAVLTFCTLYLLVASLLLLGYDAAASSNIVCNTSSVT